MDATKPSMDERQQLDRNEDVIDLGEYFAVFRRVWWKAGLLSLAVGVVTLLVTLWMPNIYLATAVVTPATEDGIQNQALGVLSSFGVVVGDPAKVEDLETLFKSNDLTVRVFGKYKLWPIVLPDRFDPATGMLKDSWTDRLFGGGKGPRPPGDWDAIRAAKDALRVSVSRKSGTVSVSFESPSAEGSASVVKYYLDEAKSRLQEEAFERASRNKKFIEEQIGKTVDVLNRDRLYSMYGQEVEREMLARNREQFGFRVIDSARVPDRKFKPQRAYSFVLAMLMAFFVSAVVLGRRARQRTARPEIETANP